MTVWQSIVETKTFSKIVRNIADEDAIEEMLEYVAKNPLAGEIIEGTSGCRKLRCSVIKAQGKVVA